jgi:type IV pilus assembly protein PilV
MPKPWFAIHKHVSACRSDNIGCAAGFTLIEVLISMIILAIGLLGLASLQAVALKNNKDAFLYTQATLLAYEMGDRIKANKAYWGPQFIDPANPTVASYNLAPVPDISNSCSDPGQACLDHEIAAYDYAYWQNRVQNTLPAPTSGVAAQIVMSAVVNTPPCTTINALPAQPAICLILTWQRTDQSSNQLSNAANLSPNNVYRLEITP